MLLLRLSWAARLPLHTSLLARPSFAAALLSQNFQRVKSFSNRICQLRTGAMARQGPPGGGTNRLAEEESPYLLQVRGGNGSNPWRSHWS